MKADLVIKNGWVVTPEATVHGGVGISDGKFVAIGIDESLPDAKEVIDANGRHILPGIIDAHVHFRDPGVTHKEDFGDRLHRGCLRWRHDCRGHAEPNPSNRKRRTG